MIYDSGISGNGSLFLKRFKAGDFVSASQLNDINSGLMTGTVQPYLGQGPIISYGGGGTQVLMNPDSGPDSTVYFQHQVFVNSITDEEGRQFDAIQVVAGNIFCQDLNQTKQYLTDGYGAYPTGMMAYGALDVESPFIAQGGYVELADPTASGNPHVYNVYIVKNQYGIDRGGTQFSIPSVCVFALDSDAETKTTPFAPDANDAQRVFDVVGGIGKLEVKGTLDSNYFGAFGGGSEPWQFNLSNKQIADYNCQRICIASVTYDTVSKSWYVDQFVQGSITIPNNLVHEGILFFGPDTDTSVLPDWYTTPTYETEQTSFEGDWDGYEKWSVELPSLLIERGYLP